MAGLLQGTWPKVKNGILMKLIAEIRSRARHIVGPVFGVCVAAYFGYHAVHGERGVISFLRLKQEVVTARDAHDALVAQRQTIEHRVGLLNPGTLDPDMLDERARLMLNYGLADEIVIFIEPPGRT